MEKDKIIIKELSVQAVIGIHDWERESSQELLIDLEIETDISKAAEHDDIQYAIDYFEISEKISAVAIQGKYQLLETLAEEICKVVLDQYKIENIMVRIAKPAAISNAKYTAIQISRTSKVVC